MRRLALGALAFAAALAAASAAQAFTIEGGPGASGPGSKWQDLDLAKPKVTDPDSRFKTEDGLTQFKSGDSTFYFGRVDRPSDGRYNTDNLFNPFARDGR